MAVKFENIKHEVFGNLLRISNDVIDLRVTLDFGPRVIHFSRLGMENMFYNDLNLGSIGEFHKEYDGDIIKLYGGHRLWISPEVMPSCYYPDNSKVTVEQFQNGAKFIAPVEKYNNIQKIITIEMDETDEEVKVLNTVINKGSFDINIAPWAITMFDKGGIEIIPQTDSVKGYLSNRSFSFWDYAKMNDERLYLGDKYITLKQNPKNSDFFKFGFNNEKKWVGYLNKGQFFVKHFDYIEGANYPDNGCNFETYTCNFMIELESLGPLATLRRNEEVTLKEVWNLYIEDKTIKENDEKEIEMLVSKYI